MQEKLEKGVSQSLKQFFLTVSQNNFGNKISKLQYIGLWKNNSNSFVSSRI